MQKKQLILFTADFPFGTGETFLETEIVYLAKGFDEIKLISLNCKDPQTRTLPSNCVVERFDVNVYKKDKIKSLFQLFNPKFWEEKKIIKSVYDLKLTKGILSTMLVSLYRAKKVEQRVEDILKSNKGKQAIFYSYWCDDVALGLALAAEKSPGLKTFSRIHGWDLFFERSSMGYLPYRQFISKHLTQLFSISNRGLVYANEVWKVDTNRNFSLSRLGVRNEKPLISVKRDFYLLVSCSGLIPLKRVHLIAESLNLIHDKKIHWVHFGDGPDKSSIEELCKKLPANISFELKGNVENQSIYQYYDDNRPDLFMNMSTSEGIPVSIMEAMSFGIPVIATNVGGTSEIVDNICGRLLAANPDTAEISDAITDFYELSSEQLTQKKKTALKKWELDFNAEKNYQSFMRMLIKS